MTVPITSLYAALLAWVYLGLSMFVVQLRLRRRVGIGDGGHHDLARAVRVHANFGEYVPYVLLLSLLMELSGYSDTAMHAVGGTLLFARLSHAIGLARYAGASPLRFTGTTLTFLLLGGCSGVLLLGIKL